MLTPEQTNEGQAPEATTTPVVVTIVAKPAEKAAAKAAAKSTSKKATAKAEPKAKREHDESEGPAPTMVNGVYVGDDIEPEVLEGVARARHLVDHAFSNQAQLDALHAVLDLVEAGE